MSNDATSLLDRRTCSALVITCSDFRFKSTERAFAEAAGLLDDYDLIARPGAARSLVSPRSPAARDVMLEEIRILWGLHEFARVIAVNHMSCLAYADLVTAGNERAVHTEHLRRAQSVIQGLFSGLRAETYLAVPGASGVDVERVI